jgi:hypothetical protein
MKGFGTSGLAADEAQAADNSLNVLRTEETDLKRELHEAAGEIDELRAERRCSAGFAGTTCR